MQVLSVLYTCFSGGAIIHELGLGEAEVIACWFHADCMMIAGVIACGWRLFAR
jgi:hypothetical protein